MDKLGIGMIGLGWPGQRHIEAYLKRDDVEIVAVSDLNSELVEETRSRFNLKSEAFSDYHDLLTSDRVDAVSICTPNFLHAPMAIDALAANKHVLLEKPLANTLEQGLRIAEAAAKSDRALMIGFNNRYRKDSRLLKQQIEEGRLGDIYYAKAGWLRDANDFFLTGWFTQKSKSGGGPLIDLGVHMLDLSLWFMGNPRPVSVSGSVYHKFTDVMRKNAPDADVEDLATALIKLDNGGTITLDVSWISYIEQSNQIYAQLFGSKGGARIDRADGNEDLTILSSQDGYTMRQMPIPGWRQRTERGFMLYDSFATEISDFIDSIRAGVQPGATVTHGLDVLRVLDAIYKSAESGEEVKLTQETDVENTTPAGAPVAS